MASSLALTSYADELSPASKAAIADGITTQLALSAGATESNPLVGPHPSALLIIAVTGLKIWSSENMKNNEDMQKLATGLWTGSAVNNVAVMAGFSNPVLWGIAAGIYFWKTTTVDKK